MADEIHAQRNVDGWLYRIWSTVVDDYVHEEMDTSEITNCLLDHAKERALEEIPERLKRARDRGTSSRIHMRDVDGPWDEPTPYPYDPGWDDEGV